MIKQIIASVSLLLNIACGEQVEELTKPKIEYTKGSVQSVELDNVVNEVLDSLPIIAPYSLPKVSLIDDLALNVEGISASTIGVCRSLVNGKPIEILIDTGFWNRATELKKLTLVAHEMLHCMYGLDHSDKGLMYPSIHVALHDVAVEGIEVALANALGVEL